MTKIAVNISAEDTQPFKPTPLQGVVKARLQARLEERRGLVDAESLSLDDLEALAGSKRVRLWAKDPRFLAWLLDSDHFTHRARALKDVALGVLEEILTGPYDPKLCSSKDKLRAADLILQVTGAYPSKTSVRFLDRDLETMEEAEVDRQLAAAKKQLDKGG